MATDSVAATFLEHTQGTGTPQRFAAAIGVVFAGVMFALYVQNPGYILREADLWWHVKTGQDILATWHFPQTDPYSYTHVGQPWIAKEWLSQVIFAFSYNLAGWSGPVFVCALAFSLMAWLLYANLVKSLQPLYAMAVAVFAWLMLFPITVARPHLLTFPVLTAFASAIFGASRNKSAPPFWALALVALWANLHASFMLSFLIAGLAFLDFLQRSKLELNPTSRAWVVFLVCCPVVPLANPYFWQPYLIALQFGQGENAGMQFISEWRALSAADQPVIEFGFLTSILLVACVRPRMTLGQVAMVLILTHMMFAHVRFIYLFFLVAPLVIAPEMAEALPKISQKSWQLRARSAIDQFMANNRLPVALLACGIGFAGFSMQSARSAMQPPPDRQLAGAFSYIAAQSETDRALDGRVFNDYNFGGPLIFHGIATYIDGRSDQIFLGDFVKNYVASADPGNEDTFKKILINNDVTWTILPPTDGRNAVLAGLPKWKKSFGDDYAVVYERQ